jgi:hypothetical protein
VKAVWLFCGSGVSGQGKVSVKFRLPVSRMMYGMVVFFFAVGVVWTVLVDVVWFGQIIGDVGGFLIVGVVGPCVWFGVFLFTVKIVFFSYHELTESELIVSVPPRRVRVPLEGIDEIETDAGKIKTDFGMVRLEVKSGEGPLEREHYWAKFKTFGVSVHHFGNIEMIQSVFSDKNLVRIKAKNHDIITNVPDVKEFVEQVMGALEKRRSSLKL